LDLAAVSFQTLLLQLCVIVALLLLSAPLQAHLCRHKHTGRQAGRRVM
jgi:hypothetical protein